MCRARQDDFAKLIFDAFVYLWDQVRARLAVSRTIRALQRVNDDVPRELVRAEAAKWALKFKEKASSALGIVENDLEQGPSPPHSGAEPNGSGPNKKPEQGEKQELSVVEMELQRMSRRKNGPSTPDEMESAKKMIVRKLLRANEMGKLTERDLDRDDVIERISTLKHRSSILSKMVGRMRNSVDTFTERSELEETQQHAVGTEPPEVTQMKQDLAQTDATRELNLDLDAVDRAPQQALPKAPEDRVDVDEAVIHELKQEQESQQKVIDDLQSQMRELKEAIQTSGNAGESKVAPHPAQTDSTNTGGAESKKTGAMAAPVTTESALPSALGGIMKTKAANREAAEEAKQHSTVTTKGYNADNAHLMDLIAPPVDDGNGDDGEMRL